MIRITPAVLLSMFFVCLSQTPAYSQFTGVGDTKVNSPSVTKDQLKLEAFGGLGWGFDGRDGIGFLNNTELSYGVTDWLKLSAYAVHDKRVDQKTRYNKTELVAVVKTSDQKSALADTGLYFSYDINHLGPNDAVGTIFMVRRAFEPLTVLANFGVKKEIGARSANDASGSLDVGFYRDIDDKGTRLGLEYFSDIVSLDEPGKYDEQNHRAGPALKYAISGTPFGVEIGWLAGLSEAAPDNVIKYQIDYKF